MTEIGVGTRLGRYRLLAPIGAGGMGSVWAALDQQADGQRFVALKLALDEAGADQKFWTALSDEANVAARIHHPNVCVSSGLGTFGDVHFLVMEWSDGASLRELLDALPDHRLPAFMAARIGIKVASGLHAAHQLTDEMGLNLGVVHRDVSPQNVLIDRRGRVRLADFGVAKARGQLRRPTETGEIKGKLSYMAPEQISSRDIDARADVFALACVIYEAALGQRAFPGGDALATMYQIMEEEPVRPRAIDPLFPERLEQALLKALAKNPNDRFQTALDFAEALEDFVDDELTEPGDRHLAKLLSKAMGEQLDERRRALDAAVARIDRGESISPPPRASVTITSTAPGGVAVTQQQRVPANRGVPLLGVLLVAGAALGASFYLLRQTPAPSGVSAHATLGASALPVVALAPSSPAVVASEAAPAPAEAPAPGASVSPEVQPAPVRAPARSSAAPVQATSEGKAATESTLMRPLRRAPAKPPRDIDQSNPFTQ